MKQLDEAEEHLNLAKEYLQEGINALNTAFQNKTEKE